MPTAGSGSARVGQRLTEALAGIRHPHLRACQAQRPRRGDGQFEHQPRRAACGCGARNAGAAAPAAEGRARASPSPVGAAHLVEARGGARELEGALAFGVERVGLGGGRADEPHAGLVERVDQGDEPLRLVVAGAREEGDVVEEQDLDGLGDGEIVGRAERPGAEIGEGSAGDAVAIRRERDGTPLDRQGQRLAGATGEALPGGVEGSRCCRAERAVVDDGAAEPVEAVVDVAGQLVDLEVLLDQRDEGQEEVAVEPVLVELVRGAVRGGDDDRRRARRAARRAGRPAWRR